MKTSHGGFTLIELVTVVAIVGILAAIAIPAYDAQMRKSRRSEAVQALGTLQLDLERYRADCPSYNSTVACTGRAYPTMPTNDYYTISVAAGATVSTYTAQAVAILGAGQDKDSGCTTMTLSKSATADSVRAPASCWPD